jgi:hypothetical protein
MFKKALISLLVSVCAVMLPACGGGGSTNTSSGGSTVDFTIPRHFTGFITLNITISDDTTQAIYESINDSKTITITVNSDNSVHVHIEKGYFGSGTISGDRIDVTGSIPDPDVRLSTCPGELMGKIEGTLSGNTITGFLSGDAPLQLFWAVGQRHQHGHIHRHRLRGCCPIAQQAPWWRMYSRGPDRTAEVHSRARHYTTAVQGDSSPSELPVFLKPVAGQNGR